MIYFGLYLLGIIIALLLNFVCVFIYTNIYNKNNKGESMAISIRIFLCPLSWIMVAVELPYIIFYLLKTILKK